MAFSDDVHKASQEHHLSKLQVGNLGVSAKPMTAFDHVDEALNFAHRLVGRIESLQDRLLGESPRSGESATEMSDGVLPTLTQRAAYTRSRLGDAMAAIDAIERALP